MEGNSGKRQYSQEKSTQHQGQIQSLKGEISSLKERLSLLQKKQDICNDITEEGYFFHEDFKITESNNAFYAMSSYSPSELRGMHLKDLFDQDSLDTLTEHIESEITTPFEIQLKDKHGNHHYVHVKVKSSIIDQQELKLVLLQNVTEYRKTKENLEESEEKHRLISNLLSDYVYTCTIKPNEPPVLGWVSGAMKNVCGFSEEEIKALKHGWFSIIHPEDVQRIAESVNYNYTDDKFYENEYRIYHKDGGIRWMLDRSMCVKMDKETHELELLGATKDITERKRIEEDLKTRNNELNNLVYKVSHDLKAPLKSVKGLIYLSKLENNFEQHLPVIEERIDNLNLFISDILSHARSLNTEVSIEPLDVEQIVNDCFDELKYLQDITVVDKYIQCSGKHFCTDKVRLTEICRNLASNAIKYCDREKNQQYVKVKIDITRERLLLTYEDNGQGIQDEYQKNIFNMFYRATEQEEGSGIGLYIVQQAIEKMKGNISVESTPGVGSVFTVELPNEC